MEYDKIEAEVMRLASYIDSNVDGVNSAAIATQTAIYEMLQEEILKFEISDAKYVIGQDFRKRLNIIQGKIEAILGSKIYTTPIRDFLTDFTTIQDKTVDLFKSVNDLEVEVKELSPAKQQIYEQAKEALSKAVAPEYVDPVKKLIAQNVMQGRSIQKSVAQLEKWNRGELASGRLAQGTPTPSLQKYATQIARDSAYSVQRTTNNIF